jgi:MFS family permease
MTETSTPRLPVTALIGTGLFFTGITYASTVNYGALVGIDTLGISNAAYALLLMVASLVGAGASVVLGHISDRVPDRRLLVIACALMGALGFGLIFIFRTQAVFIVAICAIMPVGGALFTQSFSFARAYNYQVNPARAEFMTSVLRTIFAVAWAIVPPVVGWVAAATVVFNIYGIAAAAYLAVAAIYGVLLTRPEARVGTPVRNAGGGTAPPAARIAPAQLAGIGGVTLIFVGIYINNVTVPLLVTVSLNLSFGDLGLFAGVAAAMELPFMLLWGYAMRRVSKHTIIVAAALLYALYLVLLSRAGSLADILWLQLVNGPANAALLSIPISYMQDTIRGRIGLSTSLLDVVTVTSALAGAALFGALTASAPNYPELLAVGAGLAVAGAAVLFAAHRAIRPSPAAAG